MLLLVFRERNQKCIHIKAFLIDPHIYFNHLRKKINGNFIYSCISHRAGSEFRLSYEN